jgi:hypothetical protein
MLANPSEPLDALPATAEVDELGEALAIAVTGVMAGIIGVRT